jgi:hypothetical protein
MLGRNRSNEGTHSPRKDAGNEEIRPMGGNQPETTDFMRLTRQHNSPESSRSASKRSVESAFGEEGVGEEYGSPKRSKVTEASTFAYWEEAKVQLLQQQMAETQRLREQHPEDHKRDRLMTVEHIKQLKDLLAMKPAEALPENDLSSGSNPTGSGEGLSRPQGRRDAQANPSSLNSEIMGDIGHLQEVRKREIRDL